MARLLLIVAVTIFGLIAGVFSKDAEEKKCKIPPTAPLKIQNVINECQDEIKLAIISEALQLLQENDHHRNRAKRAAFSDDERRIAGCLLQCVYRKMNAVNESGFPTAEGLLSIYTEGVTDKDYYLATAMSIYSCLQASQKKHADSPQSLEGNDSGKVCDIAYDVFDCVSDRIGEYCGGQTP
ncbi:odorant binding protein [Rhyzopertha dominica]|nr:odorant binding protein [Rhyzopertha dominica]